MKKASPDPDGSPGFGRVLMEVATYRGPRATAATAVLYNPRLRAKEYVTELDDGETIVMVQSLKAEKVKREGVMCRGGQSSFVGWQPRHESMESIVRAERLKGFIPISSQRMVQSQLAFPAMRAAA